MLEWGTKMAEEGKMEYNSTRLHTEYTCASTGTHTYLCAHHFPLHHHRRSLEEAGKPVGWFQVSTVTSHPCYLKRARADCSGRVGFKA